MSPKRGDQVPQPAQDHEWELRFDTAAAAKGWRELEAVAASNLRAAWEVMRHTPDRSVDPQRHTRLKGGLATVMRQGDELPQWQIEVTSGGRIWYLVDSQRHTVWVTYASTRHPKQTDH